MSTNPAQGPSQSQAQVQDADIERRNQMIRRLQLRLDEIFLHDADGDLLSELDADLDDEGTSVNSSGDNDSDISFAPATREKLHEVNQAQQVIFGMLTELMVRSFHIICTIIISNFVVRI